MLKALLLYIAVTYVIDGSVYTALPLGVFNLVIAVFVSAILRDFRPKSKERFGVYWLTFFAIYSAVFYASDFVTMKWGSLLIMEGGALTATGWIYVLVSSMLLAVVPLLSFPIEPKRL
jgi:carbon starvation protein CstA